MPGLLCVLVHTPTQQTLSYSFSHSVELPLGFTGVVLYLHHFCETVTFTRNNLDTVWMTFQFTSATTVPAHYSELFDVCVFILFYFHLLLSKAACKTVYTNQTHAFHLSPKVWSTTFSKRFQYLKITLLLFLSMQPLGIRASCTSGLTAHEGKCRNLG